MDCPVNFRIHLTRRVRVYFCLQYLMQQCYYKCTLTHYGYTMKELELLAKKIGISVNELAIAIKQARSLKPNNINELHINEAIKHFNWDADIESWRWTTSFDALNMIWHLNPKRKDVSAFSVAVIRTKGVTRRRSNGRNLLLLPPLIENRD